MFRKILPFIMGIVPLASLADTNPPTLLPTNTGVLIDGGNSFTYTVTGDAVINGDFVVDATADSVNSTIVDTDGAFITNTNNGNGNVSNAAGNAAGGGLTINAVNGITVAGLISNSGGTLVLNPGDGATISAAGISSGDTTNPVGNGTIIIESGANLVLDGSPNIIVGQLYGLYSLGGIYVGATSPSGGNAGDILFTSTVDKTITIQSGGNVSSAGNLVVASGYDFQIDPKTATSIDVTIGGNITNAGILTIGGSTVGAVNSLAVGDINSVGSSSDPASITFNVVSGNITMGNVTNGAYSTFSATASNNISMGFFENYDNPNFNSGAAYLNAGGSITATDRIINDSHVAPMTIIAGTTLSVGANLENSGTSMTVTTGGNIDVTGTMKNDMIGNGGTLTITSGGNLTVGYDGVSTASFENKDNFVGNITGLSTFSNGISNLSAPAAASFQLKTAGLNFSGDDATFSMMTNFMQNALNNFVLDITAGNTYSGPYSSITTQSISNGANAAITNAAANMDVTVNNIDVIGNVVNTGAIMDILAYGDMTVGGYIQNNTGGTADLIAAGTMAVTGNVLNQGAMIVTGETALNIGGSVINSNKLWLQSSNSGGMITIAGDVFSGGSGSGPCVSGADCNMFINAQGLSIAGTLTNASGNMRVMASDATIGAIDAGGGWTGINILTDLNVTNGISVHNGATLAITAADNVILGGGITGTSIANDGTLSIIAADAITLARDVTAGAGSVSNITASTLSGQSIYNSGTFTATAANGITLAGATGLYNSGTLTLNTKSLDITTGGIISTGNTIISAGQYAITNSYIPGLNANIAGDVSGPVRFVSLASMDIGGNYYFGNGSAIHALINPNGDQYASVDTNPNSSTFGVITNGTATGPIISVAGNFFTNLTSTSNDQVGITLFNIVNPGTAIWLIHTDAGVVENGGFKMRDLNVQFCNSDGTKCFDYMSSLRDPITGLPLDQSSLAAYISVRDIDGNGVNNDVYIVFDPEFGGPIKVFRIQPIVAKDPEHKRNDYVSAGALDDLIDGGLYRNGFMFNSPIEAIPVAFAGSSFDTISKEIYNRMEQYSSNRDPNPLTNLSRLFVPWEIDLMAAQMTMSEHTNGRVFANRMMDEFLWNRNRQLNKIWGDVSFGKFDQKILNPHSISGDSLEITGGFDFQHTHENIYGAMLRIRRASASLQDYMDLSYGSVSMPNGQVDVEVSDLTIGVGGYWVHRIENEMRFYGNLMLNFDMFDIDRTQNFTTKISGTGSAFSVTTEWGLLHNLWLQYLVGNVYARVGYSFGLDAKTRMGGADYMKYESDGYFILTPGYSLTLQKKMYLSPWTYIKPYLGGNVEYDIGGFDSVNYKFAPALRMTSYKVDMSPLWLTGRAGIDLAGISGWSLGFEYEYKYNDIIKMSNFRIGGAYRF